ncbi:MAG: CBS domain-containing protein, partial [Calditrichia bacterium]|nr:CBS domain-containing protein [Calditrichia bacterium]
RSFLDEEYISGLVIALDLMEEKVPSITQDDNLDDVMRLFTKYELAELPVIESRESKKIAGIIARADVIEMYNRELRKRNIAQELISSVKLLEKEQSVEFLPGTSILQVPASKYFMGKTIGELDMRKKFGVQVLVIIRKDISGEKQIFPTPDYQIHEDDHMVVMGSEKELNAVKNL